MALTRLPQPCMLEALEAELRAGYHVLHVIAHGTYSQRQQQAALYLADADNRVAVVKEDTFAAASFQRGEIGPLQFSGSP